MGIDFSRFENVRNYKHETDHMIPIIKKILLFLITFLSKTKKIMINKIINRLNTIDSPNTYKYFVVFRFSNEHVPMKEYQFKVYSNFGVKGDQNYRT